jgi:hypothetical protein
LGVVYVALSIAGRERFRKGQSAGPPRPPHGLFMARGLAKRGGAATSDGSDFAKDRQMRRFSLFVALGLGLSLVPALQPGAGPAASHAQTLGAEAAGVPPETRAAVAELTRALQIPALFDVLRDEGLASAATLEADMFPGGGGPQWAGALEAIYDARALEARFEAAFAEALAPGLAANPGDIAALQGFYGSDLGQRIVRLEIDARRAFIDDAAEDAARVAADKRQSDRDPLVRLLDDFIAAGDLIETNVAGGLSGNLAFLTGLSDTGLYGQAMPAQELMAQVWAQEAQIRADTTSWLHAYLGLAYAPLTEAEMQAYIDFMASPTGQRLNAAIFAAFDQVFRQVSYDLGRAAGVAIQGRDI